MNSFIKLGSEICPVTLFAIRLEQNVICHVSCIFALGALRFIILLDVLEDEAGALRVEYDEASSSGKLALTSGGRLL